MDAMAGEQFPKLAILFCKDVAISTDGPIGFFQPKDLLLESFNVEFLAFSVSSAMSVSRGPAKRIYVEHGGNSTFVLVDLVPDASSMQACCRVLGLVVSEWSHQLRRISITKPGRCKGEQTFKLLFSGEALEYAEAIEGTL